MRDILPTITEWAGEGRVFALARVVSTWGSAPRRVGSAMAIASSGEFVGSVSGGCVEAAVIERAGEVLETGRPLLLEFGVDDERAWSVGLSCGGRIKVLLEPFPSSSPDPDRQALGTRWLSLLESGRRFTVVSRFAGEDAGHVIVESDAGPAAGESKLEDDGTFVHVIPGREVLLVFGATDIATHLVRFAGQVGFETVVIDPRPAFAEPGRFDPQPDRLVEAWPDEALSEIGVTADTYAVLLSHNPRIDDPALQHLFRSGCAYIGALGGRKTQSDRRQRLLDAGFSVDEIDRIHGPVGLDIGAAGPAEIALSIIAEIVATRNRVKVAS